MEDKNKKIGIIALIFALIAISQAGAISTFSLNLIAGTGINITQSGDNYTISATGNITALPDNTKVNKSGDTITGTLNMSANDIINLKSISGGNMECRGCHDGIIQSDLNWNNDFFNITFNLKNITIFHSNHSSTNQRTIFSDSAINTNVDINLNNKNIINCGNCLTNESMAHDNTKVNKSGDTMTGNLELSNNTLNNVTGIQLNSLASTINHDIYNFTSDTYGNVPAGWTEDDTNGTFRVTSGHKVNLIHNSGNASSSNNYHISQVVTQDGYFSITFNYSREDVNDYSYIVFNNATPLNSLIGIYLSVHSGNLYYYASSAWNLVQAITLNQTYEIKVNNTKLSTGKFDLYIDKVLKVNQGNFASSTSSIGVIHIGGGGGGLTNELYDDIDIAVGVSSPSQPYCLRVLNTGALSVAGGRC
jgi:hypothetical protein